MRLGRSQKKFLCWRQNWKRWVFLGHRERRSGRVGKHRVIWLHMKHHLSEGTDSSKVEPSPGIQTTQVQTLLAPHNNFYSIKYAWKKSSCVLQRKISQCKKMGIFEKMKTLFTLQSIRTSKRSPLAQGNLLSSRAESPSMIRSGSAQRASSFFSNKTILGNSAFFPLKPIFHSQKCSFFDGKPTFLGYPMRYKNCFN